MCSCAVCACACACACVCVCTMEPWLPNQISKRTCITNGKFTVTKNNNCNCKTKLADLLETWSFSRRRLLGLGNIQVVVLPRVTSAPLLLSLRSASRLLCGLLGGILGGLLGGLLARWRWRHSKRRRRDTCVTMSQSAMSLVPYILSLIWKILPYSNFARITQKLC